MTKEMMDKMGAIPVKDKVIPLRPDQTDVQQARQVAVEMAQLHFDFQPYMQDPARLVHMSQNIHTIEMLRKLDNLQSHFNKSYKPRLHQARVNRCQHTDRKHYAKGLCNPCYVTKGRSKMASNCMHKTRPSYAKNMCKSCY